MQKKKRKLVGESLRRFRRQRESSNVASFAKARNSEHSFLPPFLLVQSNSTGCAPRPLFLP